MHMLFAKTVHHHFQEAFTAGYIALDRNLLVASKNQNFDGTGRHLEMVLDFICDVTNAVGILESFLF